MPEPCEAEHTRADLAGSIAPGCVHADPRPIIGVDMMRSAATFRMLFTSSRKDISIVFPFGWQYPAHTKSRREFFYYQAGPLFRVVMYAYHTERRSRSDGHWTVQDCKCSNSFLVLERHLIELQSYRWSTTLCPISVAFPLLQIPLSYPTASPAHRQVTTTNMNILGLLWIP
jgi:hypothetical protein